MGWLSASAIWAEAGEFHGKVSRVIDGDTVEIRHDGRTERIRLRGIDCPELRQPYGKQAKRAVRAMVSGRTVSVKTYGKSTRGPVLADMIIERGRSVAYILLEEGLAWRTTSGSSDEALEAAEVEARYAKRGLWSDPNPVAPWVYRASKSRTR
ncbi:endonuclease [Nitrospira sp.]|nr:endonuclease [Nitrospira sp.]